MSTVEEEINSLKLRVSNIESLLYPKSPKIVEDEGDENEEKPPKKRR